MVPDIAKKGHSFTGAFAYYLHDKGQETAERVGWTETRNVMTDDPEEARQIMTATALQADQLKAQAGVKSSGRKSNAHVYAYSLAWHPDEAAALTKGEMIAAADASLKELKADHLQAVIVCHTDQKHPHVHVILNRVDPTDGRMHPFKNDRLQLSDWANRYERERGQIVTPKREEKRQQREANPDHEKRQAYAQQKRQQAAEQKKGDLSPAAMLKDLSEAQKVRHRAEWKQLTADNKSKRTAIYADYKSRIQQAHTLHKTETKAIWRDMFRDQDLKRKAFHERERNIIGRVKNAMAATAIQHMNGELDGRGRLSATFSNALSSQKRKAIYERALDGDRQSLRTELRAVIDEEVHSLKGQRQGALKAQRASFDQEREGIITRQDSEWAKVRDAWKQLRQRSHLTKGNPVKKDFDQERKPAAPKPKQQPQRTATVSAPSPAPSPAGEVPRTTAKRQDVPAKDWSKSSTVTAKEKGLDRVEPASTEWGKANPAPSKMQDLEPSDWGAKAEKKRVIRDAPPINRDFTRDR